MRVAALIGQKWNGEYECISCGSDIDGQKKEIKQMIVDNADGKFKKAILFTTNGIRRKVKFKKVENLEEDESLEEDEVSEGEEESEPAIKKRGRPKKGG